MNNTPKELQIHPLNNKIADSDEFVTRRNSIDMTKLPPNEARRRRIAIVSGAALAISNRLVKERHQLDFEANIFALTAELPSFYDSQKIVDLLRERYPNGPHSMPQGERDRLKRNKDTVTHFNHTLRQAIEVGALKMTMNELVTFMTTQYAVMTQSQDTQYFYNESHATAYGMRDEVAVEQILIKYGVDFKTGEEEDDEHGGDIIVNGVNIDLKSTRQAAERAKAKQKRFGYDDSHIVYSGIEDSDYRGQLYLPAEAEERIAKTLIPRILEAAGVSDQVVSA